MSITRRAAGVIALSFSLAACAPAPTGPTSGVTPSGVATSEPGAASGPGATATPAAPSPSTTAAPSAAPTVAPTATPTSVATIAAPTPDPLRRTIVSGQVFDAKGATVDGAVITARSLDASVPYVATAKTVAGSYVFNDIPEGANLSFTATRDGWTTRTRVASFQRSEQRNILDFGSTASRTGAAGAAAFLSKYPEIVGTSPADGARDVDPSKLAYKLSLSEPLPVDARSRFERALRVLPADDAANGDQAGTTTTLERLEDDAFPYVQTIDGNAAVAPYAVAEGTTFLADSATRARVTWNSEGTEATLTFNAPLVASDNTAAEYQVVLVSGGGDREIEDRDGNQLGTDGNGSQSAYPAAGDLILSAFKARDLRITDLPGLTNGSEAERWAATHDNVAGFEVRRDETAPKLLGVDVTTVGGDTRIALTFSEPMAAFDGTADGLRHPELGDDAPDLANYTFMVGDSVAALGRRTLDGDGPIDVDPRAVATFGGTSAEEEEEFRFAAGAFVAARAGAAQGSVLVEVDPKDARTVRLTVIDRPDFLDGDALKARVEEIGDPAGNAVRDAEADANQPVGRI